MSIKMEFSQIVKVGLLLVLLNVDFCYSFHEKPGSCPKIESMADFDMKRVSIEIPIELDSFQFANSNILEESWKRPNKSFFLLLYYLNVISAFVFSFWENGTSFRDRKRQQMTAWSNAPHLTSLKSIPKRLPQLYFPKTWRLSSEFLIEKINPIYSLN